jgi:hypothetical protein
MRSDHNQLDLMRHAPAALAQVHRVAAETALLNPYENQASREARAEYHRREAERFEREAQR